MTSGKPSFFTELKRRNVLRAAVLYAGAVWALSQGIAQLGPLFNAPNWAMRGFVIVCAIGFPFWVVFAWFYEFTSRGIQRESAVAQDALSRHSTARKLDFAIIGVMAVAIVLLASGYFVHHNVPAASHAPVTSVPRATVVASVMPVAAHLIPAKSIAVLPFENLSTDKGNAYFADGMQDLILTKLADIGDLKVISRTSTMQYSSHPENLKQIGQQLGVATILEGSVQKAGDQVLIDVQLIDANTDGHIWAQSYQRTLYNIFGVEGEVATKVANALNAKLTPIEATRVAKVPTTNTAAYNAFMQAEYYGDLALSQFSKPDMQKAFGYYHRAVTEDPTFALAWAELARKQLAYLHFWDPDDPELIHQAKAAIGHALALQPDLEQAQLAKGGYLLEAKQDYAGALRAYSAAHALKPQDYAPDFFSGIVHEDLHQWDMAIADFHKASELNPRQISPLTEMAHDYVMQRRYSEAEAALQHALAIDPSSVGAVHDLASVYEITGKLDQMRSVLETAPVNVRANSFYPEALGNYFYLQRDWAASRTAYLKAQSASSQPQWDIKCALGDVERHAGDAAKARQYYQRCAALLPEAIRQSEAQPGNLGLVLVHLGRAQEGLAMGRRGIAKYASGPDTGELQKAYAQLLMARIQAQAGDAAGAIGSLDHVLSMPMTGANISMPLLKLDPVWDPIRKDPQFQSLLKKYAKNKPVVTPTGATSTQTPTEPKSGRTS
ncbi:MAG TPA: tetratricopeptide repeat protein [Rhodanobacteraceae bacterium]|nr:tetratricopeptide repeat protein [Rhodanobacteraceae bacterium]